MNEFKCLSVCTIYYIICIMKSYIKKYLENIHNVNNVNNSEIQNGALIYNGENNSIDLFIYRKSSYKQLTKILPLSFAFGEIKKEDDYLIAFFHNGADFVGSGTMVDIKKLIEEKSMIDILNNNYESIKTRGLNLEKEEFDDLVSFSKKQLIN